MTPNDGDVRVDPTTDDSEEAISEARRRARALRSMVRIVSNAGAELAYVWTNGKVDVLADGQRYISTVRRR